ncbi:AAA family ATPase [Brevundimonas sp. Bb-A]|uniref:AAA family ATPase n=1 Tax=Brevundimonas sp. Bb-A TaxID=2560058 RepID=UPI00128FC981|nr:AAA family ATPase [Brevundimonas sp. Bb-A]QFU32244.1 ATP-dependent zinc metalloprotease FtsH [Brevundimonas sp. Bb-A]
MSSGIAYRCTLPDPAFESAWDSIKMDKAVKDRLVAQAMLALTVRRSVSFDVAPLHGLIVLAGVPGTGKTTLARGLATKVAAMLSPSKVNFIQVDPHGLASASLGKSQQQVTTLFNQTIPEAGMGGFAVVLLDEVETIAADRKKMSLEANPVDVHRATDAVLASLDLLTRQHKNILLIATTNYPQAVDSAFLSRADLIEYIPPPNNEARAEIIRDTLEGLGRQWPSIRNLANDMSLFVAASSGMDGRRLRKAVVSALAGSIATARDPNLVTSQQMLAALKASTQANKEVGREAA